MTDDSERDYLKMLEGWPEPTKQPDACQHERFGAFVGVQRIGDTGQYFAEIRVACVDCREPFRFVGVPAGLLWDRPASSIDGLELRAPIEPEGEPSLQTRATFQVPGRPVRH